jgi:ribosomal-protein-alanine N-acetyltransferase
MCGSGSKIADDFSMRGADDGDLDAILEIEGASFPSPWPRAVFERELKNAWSHVDVLLEADGRLAGFVVYWVVADELHLLNIAIRPDLRRKGLARSALHYLERVCLERDLTYLTLEVRVSNAAAVSLYESEQYRVIHRRKNYYVDEPEDALVMAKVLEPVKRS